MSLVSDTHGDFSRFSYYDKLKKDIAVIICGDAGVNYYLNKKDYKLKKTLRRKSYFLLQQRFSANRLIKTVEY